MVDETRVATFQQLIDEGVLEIGDGYRAQNSELGGTGPIFLRAGHVTDSHIEFNGVEHFRHHLADKVRSKMSKVGDTIITTKGNSTGRTSFVTENLPPFVYSPHLSYWRSLDAEKLRSGFLRYWSRSPEFIEQLSGMKASTDMAPYLSLTDQRRLSITLPPLAQQRAIGEILGALDEKIDLNRRMNETLETLARALFKSWFVDFEPVRAKHEGRMPIGLDQATAAVFPERFHDSSIGPIPQGWPVIDLGDIANFDKGLSYKGECLSDDLGTPMINLGCFTGRGLFNFDRIKRYTGQYRERHLVRAGDLVVANTDMTQNRVIIGSPALVPKVNGASEILFTHHVFAVRFKPGEERWRRYVFFTLLKPEFREIAEGFSTGTTVLALPRDGLTNYTLCLPPDPIRQAFENLVGPLLATVDANVQQSRTLAKLRDALLPKLLSGEIRTRSETG